MPISFNNQKLHSEDHPQLAGPGACRSHLGSISWARSGWGLPWKIWFFSCLHGLSHPCIPASHSLWAGPPLGFFYFILSWSEACWGTSKHLHWPVCIIIFWEPACTSACQAPGSLSQCPVPPLPGPCASLEQGFLCLQNDVEKVVVVILDKEHRPVEKFVFEITQPPLLSIR